MGFIEFKGKVDSTKFFESLVKIHSSPKTIFIECGRPIDEARNLYLAHLENGSYLPGRQTLWPQANIYRCACNHEFCKDFAQFSRHHAEPEYIDHLFVYCNERPLVKWPDAFIGSMYVSEELSEIDVRRLTVDVVAS